MEIFILLLHCVTKARVGFSFLFALSLSLSLRCWWFFFRCLLPFTLHFENGEQSVRMNKRTNERKIFVFAVVAFKAFAKWMLFLCVGVIFHCVICVAFMYLGTNIVVGKNGRAHTPLAFHFHFPDCLNGDNKPEQSKSEKKRGEKKTHHEQQQQQRQHCNITR